MKLKKFKFKQILNLHVLNSRVYEYVKKKSYSGSLTDFNLTQIINDFKKVLHIIFAYHQANKRILFIGIPKKLELKINKLTQHIAIDNSIDIQGVISNDFSESKFIKTEKFKVSNLYIKSLLPKLFKKPDLVVLLLNEKNQRIITESSIAKIPLIIFSSKSDFDARLIEKCYNVKGFSKTTLSTSEKNIFFLGLSFLFKRF